MLYDNNVSTSEKLAILFIQIGIHHILVGCVIVEDEINKGKTEKLLTEKLKRIQK